MKSKLLSILFIIFIFIVSCGAIIQPKAEYSYQFIQQATQTPQSRNTPIEASNFGPASVWASGSCNIACHFADVTGDGLADFIAEDFNTIYVLPSTGTKFNTFQKWADASCEKTCHFADVTGDGIADFIAEDFSDIFVLNAQ